MREPRSRWTKSELVQKLAEANPHLHLRAAALARGDRIEPRGFGALAVKRRAGRISRNPSTGDSRTGRRETLPVFFKAGKQMRDRLYRDQSTS